eukprot:6085671-Amphidinium_carterae.1
MGHLLFRSHVLSHGVAARNAQSCGNFTHSSMVQSISDEVLNPSNLSESVLNHPSTKSFSMPGTAYDCANQSTCE